MAAESVLTDEQNEDSQGVVFKEPQLNPRHILGTPPLHLDQASRSGLRRVNNKAYVGQSWTYPDRLHGPLTATHIRICCRSWPF